MVSATGSRAWERWAPAAPSWLRLSIMTTTLLVGWAVLLPAGRALQWWHAVLAGAVIVGFVGSWHGQHLSTSVRRWVPMIWRNRRGARPAPESAAPNAGDPLRARITLQLRPHPHALTADSDRDDQVPWEFLISWLDRYGIRADELTVCSVTRTPPPSSLRTDVGATLAGHHPQYRRTWLSYTLSAESNVAALIARETTVAAVDGDARQRPALADVVARRMVAEFRERGWLATMCSDTAELPAFVPPSVQLRRELWTGTEYSDGFRAVYTVDPHRLHTVLNHLAARPSKAMWTVLSLHSHVDKPTTVAAYVALLTTTRPPMVPARGLSGYHGLHKQAGEALGVVGLRGDGHLALPPQVDSAAVELTAHRWPTAAVGVPIGRNRRRQAVYLGLESPEAVRVIVTGSSDFHVGIVGRIALSGQPIGVYSAASGRWATLVNRASPGQIQVNPPVVGDATIVVSDGSVEAPAANITVTLRQRGGPTSAATIIIHQDPGRADLFTISTPRGSEWLSTQL